MKNFLAMFRNILILEMKTSKLRMMKDVHAEGVVRFLNESKENKNTHKQKQRNETNAFGSLLPSSLVLKLTATLDIMLLNLLSKVALAVRTQI
jgi:hypothetical protein